MWNLFKKINRNSSLRKEQLTTTGELEQSLKQAHLFYSNTAAPDQITISEKIKTGPGYSSLEPIISYINDLEVSFLHEALASSSELNDEAISWIIFEFKKHLILNLIIKDLPFYNKYHILLWNEFRKAKAAAGYITLFKNLQNRVPYIDKVECSTDLIDTRSLYEVVYKLFFTVDVETNKVLGPFDLYTLPNYMRYDYVSARNNYLLNAYHRSDLVIPKIQTFIHFIIDRLKVHCEILDQIIKEKEEELKKNYDHYRTALNHTKALSQQSHEEDEFNQNLIAIGSTDLLFSSLSSNEDNTDSYNYDTHEDSTERSSHHSNTHSHSHTDIHSSVTSDTSSASE